jgi:hypothetical protein
VIANIPVIKAVMRQLTLGSRSADNLKSTPVLIKSPLKVPIVENITAFPLDCSLM